ncbi:MAG: helix-turn-helix domain-containing protein [Tagaea sp.]|nr:helix-turn-helix domain-containing protein [Tagaea sp.]
MRKATRLKFERAMVPLLAIDALGGASEVARLLGVSIRRAHGWGTGERPVPPGRRAELARHARAHAAKLLRLAEALERPTKR